MNTYTAICDVCRESATGFLTVRFYGDSSQTPYEAISEVPVCQACCDRDIWADAIANAAVKLSGLVGKVICYGEERHRDAKEHHVRSKGYKFEWCPRIYVGLTPFSDERVEKMIAVMAHHDKEAQEGRTLH